jgi:hypothetical protein
VKSHFALPPSQPLLLRSEELLFAGVRHRVLMQISPGALEVAFRQLREAPWREE